MSQKPTETLRTMDSLTPRPESQSYDWQTISSLWPILQQLDECPQDSIHHAEGNVGIHTRMVLDALLSDKDWLEASPETRHRLFWTAVFHDCGKPATTVHEENGRITSAKHSRVGASITRELMWRAGMPLVLREEICSLITAHQLPFWLYEREDAAKVAARLSLAANPSELLIHARADANGRTCADKAGLLDRIELSGSVFEEMGISDRPFQFANAESRFAFFERDDRSPWYEAHEEFRCEATLVCGLPGSGKDTWIRNNAAGLPSISLDQIRLDMKVLPTDNQGQVIQEGFEQARVHLRAQQDFAWNTTNVTRSNREKIIRLLRDYNARVRIVYLEVSPETLIAQNADRKASVPVSSIMKLVRKLEPPTAVEAHEVQWWQNGKTVRMIGGEHEPAGRPFPTA